MNKECIIVNFDGEVHYPHLELVDEFDDLFNIGTSFVEDEDEDEEDSILKARKKLFSKRII